MSSGSDATRYALLEAVGEVADGTPLLGETVQRLLDLIVPAFADVATLDVTSATGEMRRLGARVENPRDPTLEEALLRRHQSGDESVGVLRVVATGASQLLAPLPDRALSSIATGEEDLAMLRALDLTATLYVPLSARDRTLGVLACSVRGDARTFSPVDLRFAEALGDRIGLALDNAGLSDTVRSLERQLEATLAHLGAGVIVRDTAGRTVFANPAAAELFGARSVEELFALTAAQLMDRFDYARDDGTPIRLDELPTGAALRGERPGPLAARSVDRATGTVRWLMHTATPVTGADGRTELVVNVIEDITETKRAELTQRLLAEAGRELTSSLDVEQTLRRVARMAVPGLADWCAVAVRTPAEELKQVAVAHVDPAKVALARSFGERYPTQLDARSGAAEVVRTGRPLLIPEVTPELVAASDPTPEQVEIIREIGLQSIVIVPLVLPGRDPFGTLTLVMAESGRRFTSEDLAVAEELGRRAATALENARLYTERARIAATLLHGLLPPVLPEPPGFRLRSLLRPAGSDSEVGGDFYDAFAVPGGWVVAVGDVTGHGAEAAALTALSRHTVRTAARLLGDVAAAAAQLNEELLSRPELSLVTLCAVLVREEEGRASAEVLLAGHPPPILVRAGRATAVGRPVQLLGFDARGPWSTDRIDLEPGDLLVLYTDGVLDTFAAAERFGEARLLDTLAGARDAPDAVARVDAALTAFRAGEQRDDTAIVAVERLRVGAAVSPVATGATAD